MRYLFILLTLSFTVKAQTPFPSDIQKVKLDTVYTIDIPTAPGRNAISPRYTKERQDSSLTIQAKNVNGYESLTLVMLTKGKKKSRVTPQNVTQFIDTVGPGQKLRLTFTVLPDERKKPFVSTWVYGGRHSVWIVGQSATVLK